MLKKTIVALMIVSGMLMSTGLFSSCGNKAEEIKAKNEAEEMLYEKQAVAPATGEQKGTTETSAETDRPMAAGKAGAAPTPASGQIEEKIPSKILKTADISYQVDNFTNSRKAILAKVNRHKAMIAGENQTNDGYRLVNTMTIRVDADQFDNLVEDLMTEASYVAYKTITAQDVTEEYVDLSARMKSKKEVEAQYSEILKKARTINEILEVTEYLRAIREEIERVEGRLKYLDNRVAYSTITLTYYEKLDVVSKQPDRNFGSRLAEAFNWGWSGMVTLFLGITYLWPLWLIMGLTAWLVIWLVKRSNRRQKAAREEQ